MYNLALAVAVALLDQRQIFYYAVMRIKFIRWNGDVILEMMGFNML